MKTTHILIGLMAAGSIVMAGSVTIPHTFSANTTAKASEVNANFGAVKTAVDGNANDIAANTGNISTNSGKITANESNITALAGRVSTNENKVSSVTASSTSGITATTAGTNVAIRQADGYVMITQVDFRRTVEGGSSCIFNHGNIFAYFSSSSTAANCAAFAPVQLPDHSKIGSISCVVKKDTGSDMNVYLWKYPINGSSATGSLEATLTWDQDLPNRQEKSYSWMTGLEVDNSQNAFYLQYSPGDTDSASVDKVIYGCKISYYFY